MIISDKVRKQVQDRFAEKLSQPVTMLFFETAVGCEYCDSTRQLINEISELTDKITVKIHNYTIDEDVAKQYGVNKVPAIVLLGPDDKDYGIKFYGIPSGYEFGTLLEDIEMISSGKSGLSADSIASISAITSKVHMEVFVTPT